MTPREVLDREVRITDRLRDLGLLKWATAYCRSQGSTVHRVVSKRRSPTTVRARRRLWTIIKHTLDLSYPEVGEIFESDHSTVMAGVKQRECELEAENGRAA